MQRASSIDELVQRITDLTVTHALVVVGIAGIPGSGSANDAFLSLIPSQGRARYALN